MSCRIGIIIYCILQAIAFVFILVGTPIDQFRTSKGDFFGDTACLTFWGTKQKCYGTKYPVRTKDMFALCKDRRSRFQAAEAFSIISIAVFLLALIFGFIQLCCCRCLRWLCLILNIVGVATACVCWACMASEYNTRRGPCPKLKDGNLSILGGLPLKYGAGFALFIVGWGLCLINIIFLMLPC